ncbi:PE-PGRS family protein [Rhodovulum sp. PH10]|nr:PE-PGRS family protein [Rhodovulum sp. PH10]
MDVVHEAFIGAGEHADRICAVAGDRAGQHEILDEASGADRLEQAGARRARAEPGDRMDRADLAAVAVEQAGEGAGDAGEIGDAGKVDVAAERIGAGEVLRDRREISGVVHQHGGGQGRARRHQRGERLRLGIAVGRIVIDRDRPAAVGKIDHRGGAVVDHGSRAGAGVVGPQHQRAAAAAGDQCAALEHDVAVGAEDQRRAGAPSDGDVFLDADVTVADDAVDIGGLDDVGAGLEARLDALRERRPDHQIGGVQQPGAAEPRIHPAGHGERMAGGFDETAAGGAGRGDGAVEAGGSVRPQDDAAAAARHAVGADGGARRDGHRLGGRDGVVEEAGRKIVAAGAVAADQHEAACGAAGVQRRDRLERDRPAGDDDFSAGVAVARRVERAGYRNRVGLDQDVAAGDREAGAARGFGRPFPRDHPLGRRDLAALGGEEDAAALVGDPGRLDDAVGVAGERIDVAAIGAQLHLGGGDGSAVHHLAAGAGDPHLHLALAERAVAHQDLAAGGERDGAVRGGEGAVVLDGAADQDHVAAGRADPAEIDHRCGASAVEGQRAAGEEVGVRHVEGRSDEATAGLDHAGRADGDAGRVDQVDAAGGGQKAVDRRGQGAGHPVQGGAAAVVEMHLVAGADREGAPADDAGRAGLGDQEAGRRGLADRDGAGGRRAAGRQRLGGGGSCRGCRGGEEGEAGGEAPRRPKSARKERQWPPAGPNRALRPVGGSSRHSGIVLLRAPRRRSPADAGHTPARVNEM